MVFFFPPQGYNRRRCYRRWEYDNDYDYWDDRLYYRDDRDKDYKYRDSYKRRCCRLRFCEICPDHKSDCCRYFPPYL